MLQGINDYLNPKTPQEKTQLIFVGVITGTTLVASSFLPFFLTYSIICYSAYKLINSYTQWKDWADLTKPIEEPSVDPMLKGIIGMGIFCLGIYLYQFSPAFQVLLCASGALVTSGLFIRECVLGSQTALNKALHTAVLNGEEENITALLNRNADPFAPDESGNTAFHVAVQNSSTSAKILFMLNNHITTEKPKPTLKDVLFSLKECGNKDIRGYIKNIWEAINAIFTAKEQKERHEAYQTIYDQLQTLGNAFVRVLRDSLALLTSYLRDQISFDKDINRKNNAGNTPLDLVEVLKIGPDHTPVITQIFTTLGAKKGCDIVDVSSASATPRHEVSNDSATPGNKTDAHHPSSNTTPLKYK